jgi:hypothetical protein
LVASFHETQLISVTVSHSLRSPLLRRSRRVSIDVLLDLLLELLDEGRDDGFGEYCAIGGPISLVVDRDVVGFVGEELIHDDAVHVATTTVRYPIDSVVRGQVSNAHIARCAKRLLCLWMCASDDLAKLVTTLPRSPRSTRRSGGLAGSGLSFFIGSRRVRFCHGLHQLSAPRLLRVMFLYARVWPEPACGLRVLR